MNGPKPRKRRLFVGVALSERSRAACENVSEELLKTGFAAKYEAPEKLHLTLAFLGFVEQTNVTAIVSALAAGAALAKTCSVILDKLGAFPHERAPRVVYVGAREQGAPFRAVARSVRTAYEALGFEFVQDAVAHVTIARVRESRRPLPLVEFAPIALGIRTLTLFESLPDPAKKTSRYEIVESAQLASEV